MLPNPPVVIVLALLLTGCGSTTRPSALPEPAPVVAPKADAPVPATLLMLPAPPEPLAPGYGRTH